MSTSALRAVITQSLPNWLGSNSLSLARDDAALFNNIKQTVGLVEDVYDAVNGFNGLYEQFVILNDVMVRDGLIAAKEPLNRSVLLRRPRHGEILRRRKDSFGV